MVVNIWIFSPRGRTLRCRAPRPPLFFVFCFPPPTHHFQRPGPPTHREIKNKTPESCGHPSWSPIAPEYFSRRALHFWFFHKKMISPIPLRDFAFSGSQKLKNPLASQGRRLKAGVAKDLGGVHPEVHDVAVTPQCGGTRRMLSRDGTVRRLRLRARSRSGSPSTRDE